MFFCFVHNFFFRTTRELEYLFFLSRKAGNFFPEFNIRLYDKNSESDYYVFPPPKSEYFFQQHWESEYNFLQINENTEEAMKKDNPEKLATLGIQDEEKRGKTQHHMCWTPL